MLASASGVVNSMPPGAGSKSRSMNSWPFYMLFYTDCRGKPAEAWMVRFDDAAEAP